MPVELRLLILGDTDLALWVGCGWHASEELMDSECPANAETVAREILAFVEAHRACQVISSK